MIHPKIEKLSDQLVVLEKNKQFDDAEIVAKTIVSFFSDNELNIRPFRSSQFKDKTKNRFFPKPGHGEDLPCILEIMGAEVPIDFKFFWTKKVSKQIISGITNFSPNFEDSPIHEDCNMGIDIIVPNSTDRVILVLTDKYILRTLELHGKLTATQHEILHKWIQDFDFSNKKLLHQTLWNSFNIKVINNKFYESISRTFMNLVQHLEHQGLDIHESRQFTNRLIGRVVFCWFLKKKNIISEKFYYFSIKEDNSTEYYNNILSKLFFYTLNAPVEERTHSIRNIGKDTETPYLNGGLFEKRGYDYKDEITFPARFFHDFFEFLNEYNFTTDESTSTYQQVAVDPEMLGRIFENLLAEQNTETGEQARKAKGTFYTPREIVDYMCKEGLKTHISQKLSEQNTPENDIEKIIDQLFVKSDSEYALNSKGASYDTIQTKYRGNIIGILDNLTVIDPACGSGAFPMGMLQTILRCYERILPETKFDPAEAKKKIIENSLFGVDMEPMAVEISRLRAWLSIVVDEINEHKVEPLPNLDFKFICANSLIGLDKGIQQMGLGEDEKLKENLKELRHKYYRSRTPKSKNEIKNQYLQLLNQGLFEDSSNTKLLKSFNVFDLNKPAGFFDSNYMFGEDGFDIVIGNPPYVDSEMMSKINPNERVLYAKLYKSAKGNRDLYIPFYELGFNLLNNRGILTYITPNKYLSIGYGKSLRNLLKDHLYKLGNCSHVKVFEAGNSPVIGFYKKNNASAIFIDQFGSNYKLFETRVTDKKILEMDNRGLFLSPHFKLLLKIINNKPFLENYYKSENPFTTAEAYKLCDLVIDDKELRNSFKLINTGTIDPYVNFWGKKITSYLKGKYRYPVISKEKFEEVFPNRYKQQKRMKLILSGMRYFEVFLDVNGDYIAGKSTIIICNNESILDIKALLGLLNSRLIKFYINEAYSALGIDGGINFSTGIVDKLPIPNSFFKNQKRIIDLVNQILKVKQQDIKNDIDKLYNKIDQIIYKLYELTYDEVKVIEPESSISNEEYEKIN